MTEGKHPFLQRTMANIGWLSFDRALRICGGVLITVAVARYLGPAKFGELNYGYALYGLGGVLAALGLDPVVQRYFVTNTANVGRAIATCFALKTIAGISSYAVILAFANVAGRRSEAFTVCAIIGGSLVVNGFSSFDNWFQSQVQAKFTVYAQNAAFIIFTALRLALLWSHAGVLAFAWCAFGELVLGAALLLVLYNKLAPIKFSLNVDRTLGAKWLRESWPLLLSGLAIIVYTRIDQLMIAQIAGDHALGIYSAAVRVSEVFYFLPGILGASFFPSIVKTRELGLDAYSARRQHYFDLSCLLAVAIAITTSMLAYPAIALLYGSAYLEAVPTLYALTWATVFVFTGGARQQYLVAEGHIHFSFIATVIAALLNVLLNLWLIPKYEGLGAAIATLIAYAFSALLSSFFYRPVVPLGLEQLRSLQLFSAIRRLLAYYRELRATTI